MQREHRKSCTSSVVIGLAVFLGLLVGMVCGHGYLFDPPNRSSMWRLGYPGAPINYDDNQVWCGGFQVQYNAVNQGRCGECGDTWSLPRPRDHEEGGKYYKGIISQKYKSGNLVRMTALITAAHKGYFELRLCPKNTPDEPVTQECFDKYPLQMADGSYQVPIGSDARYYDALVRLPPGLTCDYCAIQWTYRTGNNWGNCGNGTSATGCGNQETFRNCADVSILP